MIRSSQTPADADAPLDPAVAAELEALDAALRGEAITDDALAALVRDVQATAPEMPGDLRILLADDVAAGFPRLGKAGAKRAERRSTATKAPKRRRLLVGGGFAAAAACFVLVVGVAVQGGDDSTTSSSSGPVAIDELANHFSEGSSGDVGDQSSSSGSAAAPERMAQAPQTSDPQAVAKARESAGVTLQSAPSSADSSTSSSPTLKSFSRNSTATPASGRRRVEQSVDMTVRVKSGQLDEAAGKVGDITRRAGGYVAESQVSTRSRGAGTATYTLQVASSKLDQAIGALSDLGTVTRQDQASTDITSSFDTANQRLGDAKAVRRALLRSLDRADSAGQIASLRSRIADNRRTIADLESDILQLDRRTNLTTIALALTAPSGDAPDSDDDGSWSIADAADDAIDVLGTTGGILIVAAAVLLPFGLLGGAGWAIYRARRTRLRQAALDD